MFGRYIRNLGTSLIVESATVVALYTALTVYSWYGVTEEGLIRFYAATYPPYLIFITFSLVLRALSFKSLAQVRPAFRKIFFVSVGKLSAIYIHSAATLYCIAAGVRPSDLPIYVTAAIIAVRFAIYILWIVEMAGYYLLGTLMGDPTCEITVLVYEILLILAVFAGMNAVSATLLLATSLYIFYRFRWAARVIEKRVPTSVSSGHTRRR